MLMRQDSFLSSSSRRENTPPPPPSSKPPAKHVGCMSGIFRIFSKFQLHRRRKFLTFGNKQANNDKVPSEAKFVSVSVLPKPDENKSLVDDVVEEAGDAQLIGGGLSCEIPRRISRPSLGCEILRGPKSRLEFTITSSTPPPARWLQERKNSRTDDHLQAPELMISSSSAEKRRKLLDALDKCDHDLKALKKIIQSVHFEEENDISPTTSPTKTSAWPWALVNPPSAAIAMKHSTTTTTTTGQDFALSSSLRRINNDSIYSRRHSTTTTGRVTQQHKLSIRKKQDDLDASFMRNFTKLLLLNSRYKRTCSSSWSTKAMIESVDEVCGDLDLGEKREVKRLGLELHDFICTDLIEEIVKDFGYFSNYSLPFQACRRKLQF